MDSDDGPRVASRPSIIYYPSAEHPTSSLQRDVPEAGLPDQLSLYTRTLRECRELYVSSGRLVTRDYQTELAAEGGDYVQLMDDLHRALALKVYVMVCQADRAWSRPERLLGEVLCHHLWGCWLDGNALRDAIKRAAEESSELKWYSLIRPFDRVEPLRERIGELETVVGRMANLVARCDGSLCDREKGALHAIERELRENLRRVPLDENDTGPAPGAHATRVQKAVDTRAKRADRAGQPPARKPAAAPKVTLAEALAELDGLIGLEGVKHEVRTLANFLKLQQRRTAAGLPKTDISLHMVFAGNPGTGKTTVARIVGKVFGALGVLAKGHLVETDRSGLVAEYAGQTGPKTNKRVEEALDGLLFVDEAYSLVASNTEDPYGREAAQTLLKRAEDQRERLVVVLAGYPDEMNELLRSNPGLSSRFSRRLDFVDYAPSELCQIFGAMAKKNHYRLTRAARLKLIVGMRWLYDRRDRHFGNGRTSRNLFEHAVRRMANRLAEQADISQEELVTLEADDIEFQKIPGEQLEILRRPALELHIECPKCRLSKRAPHTFLGERVRCPRCEQCFVAEWGELIADE